MSKTVQTWKVLERSSLADDDPLKAYIHDCSKACRQSIITDKRRWNPKAENWYEVGVYGRDHTVAEVVQRYAWPLSFSGNAVRLQILRWTALAQETTPEEYEIVKEENKTQPPYGKNVDLKIYSAVCCDLFDRRIRASEVAVREIAARVLHEQGLTHLLIPELRPAGYTPNNTVEAEKEGKCVTLGRSWYNRFCIRHQIKDKFKSSKTNFPLPDDAGSYLNPFSKVLVEKGVDESANYWEEDDQSVAVSNIAPAIKLTSAPSVSARSYIDMRRHKRSVTTESENSDVEVPAQKRLKRGKRSCMIVDSASATSDTDSVFKDVPIRKEGVLSHAAEAIFGASDASDCVVDAASDDDCCDDVTTQTGDCGGGVASADIMTMLADSEDSDTVDVDLTDLPDFHTIGLTPLPDLPYDLEPVVNSGGIVVGGYVHATKQNLIHSSQMLNVVLATILLSAVFRQRLFGRDLLSPKHLQKEMLSRVLTNIKDHMCAHVLSSVPNHKMDTLVKDFQEKLNKTTTLANSEWGQKILATEIAQVLNITLTVAENAVENKYNPGHYPVRIIKEHPNVYKGFLPTSALVSYQILSQAESDAIDRVNLQSLLFNGPISSNDTGGMSVEKIEEARSSNELFRRVLREEFLA